MTNPLTPERKAELLSGWYYPNGDVDPRMPTPKEVDALLSELAAVTRERDEAVILVERAKAALNTPATDCLFSQTLLRLGRLLQHSSVLGDDEKRDWEAWLAHRATLIDAALGIESALAAQSAAADAKGTS